MQQNFVDVVGYQLEKVHTGVLTYLLDSERSPLPLEEQTALANKLAPRLVPETQLVALKPIREYSFGRRLRIDLVVEIQPQVGPTAYILIECKTDSDVSVQQLEESAKAFVADKQEAPFSLIVLAVGAGQHTLKHQEKKIRENDTRLWIYRAPWTTSWVSRSLAKTRSTMTGSLL